MLRLPRVRLARRAVFDHHDCVRLLVAPRGRSRGDSALRADQGSGMCAGGSEEEEEEEEDPGRLPDRLDPRTPSSRRQSGILDLPTRSTYAVWMKALRFTWDHGGMSFQLRVLVVCHCFRESETVVRIISARRADRREQESYWS